eukprot:3139124-Prymnesium_polylepis.1
MASPHRVEVIGEATAGRAEGVARAVAGALAPRENVPMYSSSPEYRWAGGLLSPPYTTLAR